MTNEKTIAEIEEKEEEGEFSEEETQLVKKMAQAGIFYGRKKSKTHPRMKSFIVANRNGVEIIDLAKTAQKLDEAKEFLKETVSRGEKILWVATQPAGAERVKAIAKEFSHPYVVNKWVGGALTNFENIRKRVNYYSSLKEKNESGELNKYTKKERASFMREMERMEYLFKGIESMSELPKVIFIVDLNVHKTALMEARIAGLKLVALVNTDADPREKGYIVPMNNSTKSSLDFVFDKIVEAMREAVKPIIEKEKEEKAG